METDSFSKVNKELIERLALCFCYKIVLSERRYEMLPNYQPTYSNPYNNMQYPRYGTQTNGIIWVQGVEGAKAYQLTPNSNVVLMDSENDHFYIKTSDNIGMCTLRTFQFKEVTDVPKQSVAIDTTQFVTREEFNQLVNQLGGLDNGKQLVSTDNTNATTK